MDKEKFDFNKYLNNENFLNITLSVVQSFVPFIAFIIWGGFLKNLNLNNFNINDISFMSALILYATLNTRINLRRIGKIHETINNGDIQKLEEDIVSKKFGVEDDNYVNDYLKLLNEKTQEQANIILTRKTINKLRKKQDKLFRKGKDYSEITETIAQLEQTPITDTSVNLFTPNDITSTNVNNFKSKVVDANIMKNDPVYAGIKTAVIKSVLKSLFVGSIGLGFAWGLGSDVTIAYITLLITTIFGTAVIQYVLSRIYTRTTYLASLKERIKIMCDLENYILNAKEQASKLTPEQEEEERIKQQQVQEKEEKERERKRKEELEQLERDRQFELEKAKIQAEIEKAKHSKPTTIIADNQTRKETP